MKTAIVYYSMSGNTAHIAARIREELDGEIDLIPISPEKAYPDKGLKKFFWGGKSAVMAELSPLQPYVFGPGYDLVILGSPVWAGRIAPPVRTFIRENGDALNRTRAAAYVCQAGSGGEKALAGLRELIRADGLAAQAVFTDPGNKQNKENENRLRAFCETLRTIP